MSKTLTISASNRNPGYVSKTSAGKFANELKRIIPGSSPTQLKTHGFIITGTTAKSITLGSLKKKLKNGSIQVQLIGVNHEHHTVADYREFIKNRGKAEAEKKERSDSSKTKKSSDDDQKVPLKKQDRSDKDIVQSFIEIDERSDSKKKKKKKSEKEPLKTQDRSDKSILESFINKSQTAVEKKKKKKDKEQKEQPKQKTQKKQVRNSADFVSNVASERLDFETITPGYLSREISKIKTDDTKAREALDSLVSSLKKGAKDKNALQSAVALQDFFKTLGVDEANLAFNSYLGALKFLYADGGGGTESKEKKRNDLKIISIAELVKDISQGLHHEESHNTLFDETAAFGDFDSTLEISSSDDIDDIDIDLSDIIADSKVSKQPIEAPASLDSAKLGNTPSKSKRLPLPPSAQVPDGKKRSPVPPDPPTSALAPDGKREEDKESKHDTKSFSTPGSSLSSIDPSTDVDSGDSGNSSFSDGIDSAANDIAGFVMRRVEPVLGDRLGRTGVRAEGTSFNPTQTQEFQQIKRKALADLTLAEIEALNNAKLELPDALRRRLSIYNANIKSGILDPYDNPFSRLGRYKARADAHNRYPIHTTNRLRKRVVASELAQIAARELYDGPKYDLRAKRRRMLHNPPGLESVPPHHKKIVLKPVMNSVLGSADLRYGDPSDYFPTNKGALTGKPYDIFNRSDRHFRNAGIRNYLRYTNHPESLDSYNKLQRDARTMVDFDRQVPPA